MLSSAGVVTTPSVRERFSPEEIAEAHADFMLDGPSLVDEASGKGLGIFEAEPGRVMVFVSEADGDMLYITTPHDFGSSRTRLSTSGVLVRIAGYASLLGTCLLFWSALLTVYFVNWQTTALQLGLGVALGIGGVLCLAGRSRGRK